jgi:alpha-methylacyl-CoA racemase
MLLALGVVAALLEAQKSGKGQVVDAAMTDGASILMTALYGMHGAGAWTDDRQSNFLDGGAHFYNAYETKDGQFISIASIESKFYAEFLERTGFNDPDQKAHQDKGLWAENRIHMAELIKTKTRDEWCDVLEGTDVCFAPILSMSEAPAHPHNQSRETFVENNGVTQPAPAPRFSRTPSKIQSPPSVPGSNTAEVLEDWGFTGAEIEGLAIKRTIT